MTSGTAHVVGVADVGQHLAGQRAEELAQREHVGDGLAGVRLVGEEVDHRHVEAAVLEGEGHAHQHLVIEDAGAEDAVIATERAGDVLGGLAGVEADLGPLDVGRVPTQGEGGHLGGVAGAGRRLLEQEGDAEPGEHPPDIVARRQLEHPLVVVGPQVVHVEEVRHRFSPPVRRGRFRRGRLQRGRSGRGRSPHP